MDPLNQQTNPAQQCAASGAKASIAVIGAGVIGLTSALQLQQQGFAVTLIDAEGVAAGASFGNAGHIATEQVFPLASTGLLWQLPRLLRQGTLALRWRAIWTERRFFWHFLQAMRPAKWRRSHHALRQLCEEAMPAWQRLLAAHQLSDLLVPHGNLLVFEGPKAHQHAQQQQQFYAAAGVACQLLTHAQTQALCPGLADSVQCSVWFEQTGHCVSPDLLCQQLAKAFCQAGGTLLIDRVTAVQTSGHTSSACSSTSIAASKVTLQLASGAAEAQFQHVVICTGATSQSLLRPLGIELPLTAERGYHLHQPLLAQPTMAVASFDRKMILTPMADGLRACGVVEFAGVGQTPDWRHLQRLNQHAQALWPAWQDVSVIRKEPTNYVPTTLLPATEDTTAQITSSWSGERPTLADSLPAIGESGIKGVWLNLGHQHLGVTFAAYSAELLLDALQGNPAVNIMPSLSPQRFK